MMQVAAFLPPERFCFDPPDPPYKGEWDWDRQTYSGGLTPFETEVSYSCGQGRRFVRREKNGAESFYLEKKFKCEWDGSWSPKDQVHTRKRTKRLLSFDAILVYSAKYIEKTLEKTKRRDFFHFLPHRWMNAFGLDASTRRSPGVSRSSLTGTVSEYTGSGIRPLTRARARDSSSRRTAPWKASH